MTFLMLCNKTTNSSGRGLHLLTACNLVQAAIHLQECAPAPARWHNWRHLRHAIASILRRLTSGDVLDQGQRTVQAVIRAPEGSEQDELTLLPEEDLESSAVICGNRTTPCDVKTNRSHSSREQCERASHVDFLHGMRWSERPGVTPCAIP